MKIRYNMIEYKNQCEDLKRTVSALENMIDLHLVAKRGLIPEDVKYLEFVETAVELNQVIARILEWLKTSPFKEV